MPSTSTALPGAQEKILGHMIKERQGILNELAPAIIYGPWDAQDPLNVTNLINPGYVDIVGPQSVASYLAYINTFYSTFADISPLAGGTDTGLILKLDGTALRKLPLSGFSNIPALTSELRRWKWTLDTPNIDNTNSWVRQKEAVSLYPLLAIKERQLAAGVSTLDSTGNTTYTLAQLKAFINEVAPYFLSTAYTGGASLPVMFGSSYADGAADVAGLAPLLTNLKETCKPWLFYGGTQERWQGAGIGNLGDTGGAWGGAKTLAEMTWAMLTEEETEGYDQLRRGTRGVVYQGGPSKHAAMESGRVRPYVITPSILSSTAKFWGRFEKLDFHGTFDAQGVTGLVENEYCLISTATSAAGSAQAIGSFPFPTFDPSTFATWCDEPTESDVHQRKGWQNLQSGGMNDDSYRAAILTWTFTPIVAIYTLTQAFAECKTGIQMGCVGPYTDNEAMWQFTVKDVAENADWTDGAVVKAEMGVFENSASINVKSVSLRFTADAIPGYSKMRFVEFWAVADKPPVTGEQVSGYHKHGYAALPNTEGRIFKVQPGQRYLASQIPIAQTMLIDNPVLIASTTEDMLTGWVLRATRWVTSKWDFQF